MLYTVNVVRAARGPIMPDVVRVERAVARLAARQSGVASRAQLVRLDLGDDAIDWRLKTGRLLPIYRGVYAVGHDALSDRGRVIAALLAAGPNAAASHTTAAALLDLLPSMPAVLHVTTTTRARRSRPGLIIHETTTPPEIERRRGIPLTAPLRTLADLAYPPEIVREALAKRLIAPERLQAPPQPTRSELERRMCELVRRAGLPKPEVNHPMGRYVIDFAWLDHRVLVETDGYATHGHHAAFEADRSRDAHLQALGYVVLRFTWRQITLEPLTVVARLAQVLGARLSRGSAAPAPAHA